MGYEAATHAGGSYAKYIDLRICMINGDMILTKLLYPPRCPACHDLVRGDGRICPECRKLLSYVTGPICCKCGKEIRFEEEELCLDCRTHKKSFDGGIALLNYDDIARESMVKFKYGQRKEYGLFYAEEIARLYESRIRRFAALILGYTVERVDISLLGSAYHIVVGGLRAAVFDVLLD